MNIIEKRRRKAWARRTSTTHFGIAFILANIFELRSEMGKIGEK